MDQRAEFVALVRQGGSTHVELCRRFGVSPKTGYKWLKRAAGGSASWAEDLPRRPHTTPGRTQAAIEAAVLAVRDEHPAWGARKIEAWLAREPLEGKRCREGTLQKSAWV